jgi:hypothetical protein
MRNNSSLLKVFGANCFKYLHIILACIIFSSLSLTSCGNAALTSTTGSGTGVIPLNLIYYGAHTAAIDSLIVSVRPQYVIVNTPQGLWGQIGGDNVLQDIASYQAAGIKVIGYITSGYEGTHSEGDIGPQWYSLAENEQLIKKLAELDGVNGVFIDECSAFPSPADKVYLTTLTDLAHSLGLLTWGNVGEADFDPWYFTVGGFDLIQSNEDWSGQNLTPVQKDWCSRISVTGNSPKETARGAFGQTVGAWKKGLAYCYFSDTGYDSLPSWLGQYAQLLQVYVSHSKPK